MPVDKDPSFIKGYDATTPEAAETSVSATQEKYGAPGSAATAYKAHWKPKPILYPYGTNDEGGK